VIGREANVLIIACRAASTSSFASSTTLRTRPGSRWPRGTGSSSSETSRISRRPRPSSWPGRLRGPRPADLRARGDLSATTPRQSTLGFR
jgi:hypothetical protein